MIDFFVYNNGTMELNREEILLISDIAALYKRNPDKAHNELKYIFLMNDYRSPFSEFNEEEERKNLALEEANLTVNDLTDELFMKAEKKYIQLCQPREVKLLQAAQKSIDELIIFFKTVKPSEKDPVTGKYLYNPKDLQVNIKELDKTIEGLRKLESAVISGLQLGNNGTFGSQEIGLFD